MIAAARFPDQIAVGIDARGGKVAVEGWAETTDMDAIERAMQPPELGHYRPWLEDLRKEKPYQLEARVEQLQRRDVARARHDVAGAGLERRNVGRERGVGHALHVMAVDEVAAHADAVGLAPVVLHVVLRHHIFAAHAPGCQ